MRFTKLSLFIAGAVGILMLGAPRAAHAVAAALVQVTNTASSPVIAQGIGNQAAQIVQIECGFVPGAFPTLCFAMPATGIAPFQPPPYVVPAGQTLVVTAVDMLYGGGAACNSSTVLPVYTAPPATAILVARKSWILPAGTGTAHYVYPSGILFPPGTTIDSISDQTTCSVTLDMHGYLTAQ